MGLLKEVIEKNKLIKPIWLMRQAGRYLPEFREIGKNLDFVELCLNKTKFLKLLYNQLKDLIWMPL